MVIKALIRARFMFLHGDIKTEELLRSRLRTGSERDFLPAINIPSKSISAVLSACFMESVGKTLKNVSLINVDDKDFPKLVCFFSTPSL